MYQIPEWACWAYVLIAWSFPGYAMVRSIWDESYWDDLFVFVFLGWCWVFAAPLTAGVVMVVIETVSLIRILLGA